MPTVIFNGKTYHSIDDMPAGERQAYEQVSQILVDKNGNGIPDLLEGDMVQNVLAAHSTGMHVNVNGKVYHTLEDLPPDLRESVDGAFKMLSNMGMIANTPAMENPPSNRPQQVESKPFLSTQASSVIEEDKGSGVFFYAIVSVVLCFAILRRSPAPPCY
ncbi:MAG: hypothetical protein DYG86_02945 [Chloroflexi bacterium CFX2]|nr:hypothetical protein [Chloroflexi bacterium CFX2]